MLVTGDLSSCTNLAPNQLSCACTVFFKMKCSICGMQYYLLFSNENSYIG